MKKLGIAMLMMALLALAGGGARAASDDTYAFSTDGAELSFISPAGQSYVYCPLTVTGNGKVTIRCTQDGAVGQFGVQNAKGVSYLLEQNRASPRSLYLHQTTCWVCVYTGGNESMVRLSATLEALPSDTEPNDTPATAQPVSLPGTASGLIGALYDRDMFRFSVSERQGMTFNYNCSDQTFPSSFKLNSVGGQFDCDLIATPTVALDVGDYYVSVTRATVPAYSNETYTTDYTFSAQAFRCVDSLSLEPEQATMEIGDMLSLRLSVAPANHGDKLAFTSSSDAVATVTGEGLVKAVGSGTATIRCAAASGASAQTEITVRKAEAGSFSLPKTCKATRGFTYSMSDWVNLPDDTRVPDDLKWSSSKPGVASITPDGILTCNKLGKAKITAVDRNGKAYSTRLTVVANQMKYKKPKGEKGYITSYPKRVYYKGDLLYIEVFLYNRTKYNLLSDPDGDHGYTFELYDLAKSGTSPIMHRQVRWNPGRIPKGRWKVFKITLDRNLYDGYDLGLGQLYPVIYTDDVYYIVKGIPAVEPMPRRIGGRRSRADSPADYM